MAIIFHITGREAWDRAKTEGLYRTEMLPVDGFIHCSTREQVIQVADSRFRGRTGLVLLLIDTDKVTAEIRYENLEGGREMFPHIYGGLDIDAVVRVEEFEPGPEGFFAPPSP